MPFSFPLINLIIPYLYYPIGVDLFSWWFPWKQLSAIIFVITPSTLYLFISTPHFLLPMHSLQSGEYNWQKEEFNFDKFGKAVIVIMLLSRFICDTKPLKIMIFCWRHDVIAILITIIGLKLITIEEMPTLFFVFMVIYLLVPIICLIVSLTMRIKEINSGEEDEAKKY